MHRPFHPYEWANDLNGVRAIQALALGVANEGQQKQAIETIFQICGLDDLSYSPDSTHDTAFAEGKRYVGNQVLKLAKLSSTLIQEAENGRSGKPRSERRPKQL